MKTDDLIQKLSSEAIPAKRQDRPMMFALKGSALAILVLGLLLVFFQPNTSLGIRIEHFEFFVGLFGFAGVLVSGLLLTAWGMTPGRAHGRRYLLATLFFLIALLLFYFLSMPFDAGTIEKGMEVTNGVRCGLATFVASFILSAVLTFVTRNGASVRPSVTGLAIAAASFGFGGIMITVHCGSENVMHIALWHYVVPILLIAPLGYFLGRKFLRW
jgi:hypothetical protein